MKIPSSSAKNDAARTISSSARASNSNRAASSSSETAFDDGSSSSNQITRDFAAVFDEIAHPSHHHHDPQDSAAKDSASEAAKESRETRDAKHADERADHAAAERNKATKNKNNQDDGSSDDKDRQAYGGQVSALQMRQTPDAAVVANARQILHIVDLEKLVAGIRTQINADGKQEITMQLSRSVLEGLRVKITRAADGQINAEFIAASEQVRSQLQSRSTELAEILRGRGVQLATLRTSTDAGDSSSSSNDNQRRDTAPSPLQSTARAEQTGNAASSTELIQTDASSSSTYRA